MVNGTVNMYNPIRRAGAGLRLAPLPNKLPRIPVIVKAGGYKKNNPVFKNLPKNRPKYRQLSSLQSHRSRVFARRRSALPNIRDAEPINQKSFYAARKHAVGRVSAPDTLRVVPGRVSASQFPSVFLTANPDENGAKIILSKVQYGNRPRPAPKVSLGVAGMSSKEAGTHHLKSDKMAMGWAEIRAAQTIPNLRDSQELDRPADHEIKPPADGHQTSELQPKNSSETRKPTNVQESKPTNKKQTSYGASISTIQPATTGKGSPHKKHLGSNSKLSSGYGSLSSSSPRADEVPRHPIFRHGDSHSEPAIAQKREMVGIYSSVVQVEDKHASQSRKVNKNHILNEREAQVYKDMTATYSETAQQDKQRRKALFFKKLQDVQIDTALQHNREVTEQASRKEASRRRQQEQLRHIRSKFEEERVRRLKTQYVTKNFLSYEKTDRVDYGLPEQHMHRTEYHAKLKHSGGEKVTALAFVKRQVKLKKSYSKMFTEPKSGGVMKQPKMEGVDQVTLEVKDSHGRTKKSKIDVKEELKKASKMVKDVNDREDDIVDGKLLAEPSLQSVNPIHTEKEVTRPAVSHPNHIKTSSTKTKDLPVKESSRNTKTTHTDKNKVYSKPINSDKKSKVNDKAFPIVMHSKDPPHTKAKEPSSAQAGKLKPHVVSSSSRALPDAVSVNSRISVITEESEEEDEDFYEKLMAKYGIELSDDDEDA